MVRRLARALAIVPGHPAEVVDRLRGTGLQGARNRRLLGAARPPKGPLDGGINTHGAIALRHGFGATEEAEQSIEQFVDRAIADRFLWNLHLFSSRSKETAPFE